MLEGGEHPKMIWIDEGGEFEAQFKSFCLDLGIKRYNTKTVKKAAYAERAIRSLKNLIYRYMEDTETYRYLPKLKFFVKTMNTRENRSIHMAPKDVTNRDVLRILNDSTKVNKFEKPSFCVGDYVRAVIKDAPFRKGCKPQFSHEIYKITKILTRNPVTYKIEDRHKVTLAGRFYEKQLIHYSV